MSEQQTPYQLIGGEQAVLMLVERFYFYMDSLEEVKALRALHADDLSLTKEKLFKFLSGWLGGPDLFVSEYGHPRLKQRHFSVEVSQKTRDEWMLCMDKALYELSMADLLRKNIHAALANLATHMINVE